MLKQHDTFSGLITRTARIGVHNLTEVAGTGETQGKCMMHIVIIPWFYLHCLHHLNILDFIR